MKIAIMGAGAVGCYNGAMLARAGYDVVLVGRASHVDAINRDGLLLDFGSSQEYVPAKASTDPEIISGSDMVLFCVKSPDTADAGIEIKPYLRKDTIVLSLQNGVDNAERLSKVLEMPVVSTVVYVATSMAGPGHVKHNGQGVLVIGVSDKSDQIAAVMRPAGINVDISENAASALWDKMIVNCTFNALSAIVQLPSGELATSVGIWDVMRNTVEECIAVAKACGVVPGADVWDKVEKIARNAPGQYSSTAQDLARGKPSEIDYINGYIVRKGTELGIPTPTNLALYSITKLRESATSRQA